MIGDEYKYVDLHLKRVVGQKYKKCTDRSMEVKLPDLIGYNDRPTDRQTDRTGHIEVSFPIRATLKKLLVYQTERGT